MRRHAVAALLAFALALLAACGRGPQQETPGTAPSSGSEPKRGGTLVVAHWEDPVSFNPNAKIDDAAFIINHNIFEQLVTLNSNYEIIPELAETWSVSEDGKTYTFHLRKGVKWHDGTPFTSADVKWTLDTIIEKKGQAYANLQVIDRVETPDEHTVVVHLKEPNAPFLAFLGWYATFIMPKHIYEGTDWLDNPANQKPIGTGPFKFVEWVKGERVVLEAFDEHWAGRPYVDRLVFRIIPDKNTAHQAFLNGEADINNNRPNLSEIPALQQNPDVRVITRPMPSRYYVAFNFRRPITGDLRVRKAISMALDREEIVQKALKGFGQPAEGYYTPVIDWAYNPDAKVPAYDPAGAERLLDEAGYPRGANGVRFKLTLPYFTGGEWADMAAVIKDQLARVGIEVTLQQFEIAGWTDKVVQNHDFDLALLNGFHGPDPDNLRLRTGTEGSIQFMGYSNPELDRVYAEGARVTDPAERARFYHEAQRILAEDVPIAPLAEVVNIQVFHKYVRNFPQDPEAPDYRKVNYYDFHRTWLDR